MKLNSFKIGLIAFAVYSIIITIVLVVHLNNNSAINTSIVDNSKKIEELKKSTLRANNNIFRFSKKIDSASVIYKRMDQNLLYLKENNKEIIKIYDNKLTDLNSMSLDSLKQIALE